MLEAVNSVLQTAQFVRGNNEQISTVDSYAANPERVQHATPQAPYISPYIHVDVNYNKAVIQLRNGDTGDVEDQFPSEAALQAAARQASRRAQESQSSRQQQAAPKTESRSAQAYVQQAQSQPQQPSQPQAQPPQRQAITAQQQQAFQAAAQSGNSNAGNVTLFA